LGEDTEAAGIETDCTDESLLLRLQAKDVEALGFLYRRYARLVYSVCNRILRDPTEAQDLVHEVFLGLYRKCKSFDPAKGAARSWIIQLAYSKCFDWCDYLRARHGRRQGDDLLDTVQTDVLSLPQEPDPAYFILWNASMVAAFKSLSDEQQETLKLFYFKGYTFQEIAEEKGYSYVNVKHHAYRGIERLRSIIFEGTARKAISGAMQKERCESRDIAR